MSPAAPGAAGPAVVAEGIEKRFEEVVALRGASLRVEAGELFGCIGPDGAGKTTLFRVLTGLVRADAGRAAVLGQDVETGVAEIRRRVGYMPGRAAVYSDLSVAENLRFFASVYGTDPEEGYELVAPVYSQIEAFADRRARDLSGGMRQKLALSCALVHRPELLLLDEPTTGVDAVSRREFWDLLRDLVERGLTVVVSTPYMDEADRCDRVALLQEGRVLRVDEPGAIGAGYGRPLLGVRGGERHRLLAALRSHPHAGAVFPFGEEIHFTDGRGEADPERLAPELARWLRDRGIEAEVRPVEAGIEDVFIALMGEPAAAGLRRGAGAAGEAGA